MDYTELENFIKKEMRMTHIYQPIMIKTLLESKGNTATVEQIARRFLNEDSAQLEYYKRITKRWPHQILKKHNVVSYRKNIYTLLLEEEISREQRQKLIEFCDLRLYEFIDRDPLIRKFRELDKSSLSGSLRYDVLSRSKGMCVACGAKSTEASMHIDHIIPRSLGGRTEIGNLQALCYRCNTEKRNRDETDFLRWHNRLKYRNRGCTLCEKPPWAKSNGLAYALTAQETKKGHSLVIPNRHVGSFIDMIPSERSLCLAMVDEVIKDIREEASITKFNVSGFDNMHENHCCIKISPAG